MNRGADTEKRKPKKGGNKTMNKLTRKLAGAATVGMMAITGMVLGIAQKALAVDISTNDAAAIVVTITPDTDRGVEISSGDVVTNLGTVGLGISTYTMRPATVTIVGNMANTELNMAGSITGGWSYDNTQAFTSTGTNLLNVWASFTSISSVTRPSQGDEYFRVGTSSGAKLTSTSGAFGSTAVGLSGSDGVGRFEPDDPAADMDVMSPGNRRHLWLFFRLPPTTSLTSAQDVNFVLSVRAGP